MAVILIIRDHFSIIFTSSKTVQDAVSKLGYLLAVTMVLNSVQPVISGVAVGGGWQGLVAYINIGVKGLWGGMICGVILQTLILLLILYKTNWKKEVGNATEK